MNRANRKLICCWVTAGILFTFVMGAFGTRQLRDDPGGFVYALAISSCVVLSLFFAWIVIEIFAWTSDKGTFGSYDREFDLAEEEDIDDRVRMKKEIEDLNKRIKELEDERMNLLKTHQPTAPLGEPEIDITTS